VLIQDRVPKHGLCADHFFSIDPVAIQNVGLFDSFFTGLGTKAEMRNNTATISNSIC
jgi:hypothetical protein